MTLTYLERTNPLSNTQVLYAAAHGNSQGTIFKTIRLLLGTIRSSEIRDQMMEDITAFIRESVLYSPASQPGQYVKMASGNSTRLSSSAQQVSSVFSEYQARYNSPNSEPITAKSLKQQFDRSRKSLKSIYNTRFAREMNEYIQSYNTAVTHITISEIRDNAPDHIALLTEQDIMLKIDAPIQPGYYDYQPDMYKSNPVGLETLAANQAIIVNRFRDGAVVLSDTITPEAKSFVDGAVAKVDRAKLSTLFWSIKSQSNLVELHPYFVCLDTDTADFINMVRVKNNHVWYHQIITSETLDSALSAAPNPKEINMDGLYGVNVILGQVRNKIYVGDAPPPNPAESGPAASAMDRIFRGQNFCKMSKLAKTTVRDELKSLNDLTYKYICDNKFYLSYIILYAWMNNFEHLTIFADNCRVDRTDPAHVFDRAQHARTKTPATRKKISRSRINQLSAKIKKRANSATRRRLVKRKTTPESSARRKAATAVATANRVPGRSAPCPDGKELNPATNRCRKKCGAGTVRKLNSSTCLKNKSTHCPPDKELNPKTSRCRAKCLPGKIRSDHTGRCLNKPK